MSNRNVPVSLADPMAGVYNAAGWEELGRGVANPNFTAVEVKAFYVIGLILEICASVDCLLKAHIPSLDSHPLAYEIFKAGGRHLPAFGVFASGIELLGRCLTGNKTSQVNENLRVGFHYLAKPTPEPLLSNISTNIEVITSVGPYTVQDLIDLRNYATHGQSTVGRKDSTGKRVPASNPPGIKGDMFGPLPQKVGSAVGTFWTGLQHDPDHCIRLAEARIDPYSNRAEPLRHIIQYFGQEPHQPASRLFDQFEW